MQELTYEQKNIILDNFGRRCPRKDNDDRICGKVMEPLSTMCRSCGTRTPFAKVDSTSYIEHFENKKCDIAKDVTFWYCIHPKINSTIEELQQFCIHCITIDLVNSDVEIINDPDQ